MIISGGVYIWEYYLRSLLFWGQIFFNQGYHPIHKNQITRKVKIAGATNIVCSSGVHTATPSTLSLKYISCYCAIAGAMIERYWYDQLAVQAWQIRNSEKKLSPQLRSKQIRKLISSKSKIRSSVCKFVCVRVCVSRCVRVCMCVGVFEGEKTRKSLTQEIESKGNRERVGKSG